MSVALTFLTNDVINSSPSQVGCYDKMYRRLWLRLRETCFLHITDPIAELYILADFTAFVSVLFGFFGCMVDFSERVFGVADGFGDDV